MVLHPETVDQFKAYFQDKHITHLAIYGESMVLKTIAVLLKDAGVSVDYLLENGKKSSEYAKTIHSRDIHKYPDTQCILIGDVRFEKNILEKVHKRTKIPVITISEAMHYKKDSKRTPQNKKKPACNRRKSPTVSRFLCFYVFIPPARRVLESESKKFHKRHRFYRQCKPECFPDTVAVSGSRETYDEQ